MFIALHFWPTAVQSKPKSNSERVNAISQSMKHWLHYPVVNPALADSRWLCSRSWVIARVSCLSCLKRVLQIRIYCSQNLRAKFFFGTSALPIFCPPENLMKFSAEKKIDRQSHCLHRIGGKNSTRTALGLIKFSSLFVLVYLFVFHNQLCLFCF